VGPKSRLHSNNGAALSRLGETMARMATVVTRERHSHSTIQVLIPATRKSSFLAACLAMLSKRRSHSLGRNCRLSTYRYSVLTRPSLQQITFRIPNQNTFVHSCRFCVEQRFSQLCRPRVVFSFHLSLWLTLRSTPQPLAPMRWYNRYRVPQLI
jgi:hypothetical protein